MEDKHVTSEPARVERADSRRTVVAAIRSQLLDAAHDTLANAHLDTLVVDDADGHHFEHVITSREAHIIDHAQWSAGETMELDRIAEHVVHELEQHGFALHSSNHLEVTVTLRQDR